MMIQVSDTPGYIPRLKKSFIRKIKIDEGRFLTEPFINNIELVHDRFVHTP